MYIDDLEFLQADLTRTIDLGKKYDLVISLEVAEHLPPRCAEDFVDTLCRHGDTCLFSAAILGQVMSRGSSHLNERFLSYWRNLFDRNGYEMVDMIRPSIWDDEEVAMFYRQNAVLFISKKREDLLKEAKKFGGVDISLQTLFIINYIKNTFAKQTN